ncbi:MAG: type I restriction enzyme HsdR N-terminal domain-containing protein [Candidatus Paceibacterota bacterium]
MENWNKLCYYLFEKIQTDITETEFEPIVEKGLEILGWDEFSGDFEIRPNYQLGSSKDRMTPDFVVKSNQTGEKLFVIEIKRPKVSLSNQNQIQLSTYMRQFKLDFGILIGPQIQVFYDGELNQNENATLIENIEFKRDNEKGKKFTELFAKDKFDKDALSEFAKKAFKKINEMTTEKEIKDKLLSDNFKETVSEIILEKLSVEYDINLVVRVLKDIKLEISEKYKEQITIERIERSETNRYSRIENGNFEIVLNPPNERVFKEKLLKTKSATIKYFYDNGQTVNKHWDASRFTRESSLMGNITSKSGIRKKERIEQGVVKVEISINE